MPACARAEIVLDGEVAAYHCYTRCVRGAFLCGVDERSGKDYSQRRDWIQAFAARLAGLFAVEAGFHVEMSNHLHLVLRTRPDVVDAWSDEEVARRMKTVHRLVHSRDGQTIEEPTADDIGQELQKDEDQAKKLRKRLASISSFMGALCEHIARRANTEDQSRGRFFEGRFKADRLDSEAAILLCGIYVDLNQIRAGEVLTPEESTHTSAYDRITSYCEQAADELAPSVTSSASATGLSADAWLCELTLDERADAFDDPGRLASKTGARASDKGLLPIRFDEYLQLLDWTGRTIRDDKRGAIPAELAPIFQRLGINGSLWTKLVTKFDRLFGHVIGTAQQLAAHAERTGRRWCRGAPACREAFG